MKNFGRGLGGALYLSSFSVNYRPTNYNLQRCKFLKFWKIPEIASTVEFLFPEAGAKRFSERPASIPQKYSSMAVLLRSFLTFLKKLFFKKIFVHAEISTEYKNVSEYKNFSEFKYWNLHHLRNHNCGPFFLPLSLFYRMCWFYIFIFSRDVFKF